MGFSPDDPVIQEAIARGLIEQPTKRKRTVKTQAAHWSVTLTLPCRVVSEANRRDHWTVRRKRFQEQAAAVFLVWDKSSLPMHRSHWNRTFPLAITLIHIGRKMDSDNLAGAFKGIRDEIARLIGIDDGDERIAWEYEQRAGTPGVEVKIEPANL